jgi:hypothetical protein
MNRFARSLILVLVAAVSACSPLYVIRAGYEEAKDPEPAQAHRARHRGPGHVEETRRKLRSCCRRATSPSTRWPERRRELHHVLVGGQRHAAARGVRLRKDRFQAYTWWFPIVGRVPYKGFFNFATPTARRSAWSRPATTPTSGPSGAFSTLGWFNDPLLNTLLRYDDVSLVGTVIHELLHNTVYIPGQVAFNESFANFVGDRGAIEFFCAARGRGGPRCRAARDSWATTSRTPPSCPAGRGARGPLRPGRPDVATSSRCARSSSTLARRRSPRTSSRELRTRLFRGFMRRPLNNATLIGTRLYYDRLDLFEAVFRSTTATTRRAPRHHRRARASPTTRTRATALLPPTLARLAPRPRAPRTRSVRNCSLAAYARFPPSPDRQRGRPWITSRSRSKRSGSAAGRSRTSTR